MLEIVIRADIMKVSIIKEWTTAMETANGGVSMIGVGGFIIPVSPNLNE